MENTPSPLASSALRERACATMQGVRASASRVAGVSPAADRELAAGARAQARWMAPAGRCWCLRPGAWPAPGGGPAVVAERAA
eukprot:576043-Lingulodinium_polyedra.AAC.1